MIENLPEDVIIDLSQPGIVHRIYPTGRSVPESMMDPNIGGNLKKNTSPENDIIIT